MIKRRDIYNCNDICIENEPVYPPNYTTSMGCCYHALAEEFLTSSVSKQLKGKVQLILTSPPFPLNKKKQYGNLQGKEYIKWLTGFAPLLADFLTPDGSIVIEIGNAWEPKRPVQSLLPIRTLLSFVEHPEANLRLCQEFVCYNPARLPSPAQWVTIKRNRVTDSFTRIWWMSTSDEPKADNSKVLRPYSKSMQRLLRKRKYNSGKRPSGHTISKESFLTDHGGSIMPNVFELEPIDQNREPRLPTNAFSISNTSSNDHFNKECRARGIKPHPARMPLGLASFFIEFLTDPGDLVFDPFAGSNTTGFCAEKSGRQWISIESREDYIEQSKLRFSELDIQIE